MTTTNDFDITIIMGYKSVNMNPFDGADLGGGAEKSIINLAKYFGTRCKTLLIGPVYTTSSASERLKIDNKTSHPQSNDLIAKTGLLCVNYQDLHFDVNTKYLIFWRDNGIRYYIVYQKKFNVTGRRILDIHDFVNQASPEYAKLYNDMYYIGLYDTCMVKSNWHKSQNSIHLKTPYCVIQNPLDVQEIQASKKNLHRHNFRLCHASSPDRGIVDTLEKYWPEMKKRIPELELHVYYGRLNFIHDKGLLIRLLKSLKQEGIYFHNRVSQEEIYNEFQQSQYYLYLSNDPIHEADCMVVREASILGCTPILHDHGVFKDRLGHRINPTLSPAEKINQIVDIIQNQKTADITYDPRETTVEYIGNRWLEELSKPGPSA